MTHIENLRGIIELGGLTSHNAMTGKSHFKLSNDEVQAGRAAITVPVTGRLLHDYVPLYFGWKTPMVAYNSEHNENMLFLRFSLNVLERGDVVFTDGNARTIGTVFFKYTVIDDLAALDPSAINAVRYRGEPEKNEESRQKSWCQTFFLPLKSWIS